MKTSYYLLILIIITFMSCHKDDFKTEKTKGILHIDIGLSVNVNEMSSTLKSLRQTDDFKVIIYKSDGTEVMSFEHSSVMPDTIELFAGTYFVEAFSDNNLPAAFENPYYYGTSELFTIQGNQQQSIMVNCRLANTIVTVKYSDNAINHFNDYKTTVSSTLGSLVYNKNETRKGYFRTMPLTILAELTYLKPDGSLVSKTLSGNISSPLANRHYEIFVDASIYEGMASIKIFLDDTEAETEVILVSDSSSSQQNDGIAYGGLLITEIMFDPSSLTDTYGEWFEILNNTSQSVNLKNLIIRRDSTNIHTVSDSLIVSPGGYFVFKRTQTATDVTNSYIYGSDISLPNTGAELSIFNKGTESLTGSLIFSVNYGRSGFPNLPGSSICLDPDKTNAADAVLGTSWCTSASVYNTGDLGTPGVLNDNCP